MQYEVKLTGIVDAWDIGEKVKDKEYSGVTSQILSLLSLNLLTNILNIQHYSAARI